MYIDRRPDARSLNRRPKACDTRSTKIGRYCRPTLSVVCRWKIGRLFVSNIIITDIGRLLSIVCHRLKSDSQAERCPPCTAPSHRMRTAKNETGRRIGGRDFESRGWKRGEDQDELRGDKTQGHRNRGSRVSSCSPNFGVGRCSSAPPLVCRCDFNWFVSLYTTQTRETTLFSKFLKSVYEDSSISMSECWCHRTCLPLLIDVLTCKLVVWSW